MKFTTSILTIACAMALSACASMSSSSNAASSKPTYSQAEINAFTSANQAAIDKLIAATDRQYLGQSPVLVSTVVNVNNMMVTAPLGRTLSEQYSAAMVNHGLNVTEMKLRDNLYIREETGELMLSREIKDIARSHKAALVLVGTYSTAKTMTLVSIKLVRTEDARIVSAYNYAIPNDADTLKLLAPIVK